MESGYSLNREQGLGGNAELSSTSQKRLGDPKQLLKGGEHSLLYTTPAKVPLDATKLPKPAVQDEKSQLETKSTRMPERQTLLPRQAISAGLSTPPHSSSLVLTVDASETNSQRSIAREETDLSRCIMQSKSKLSQTLESASVQSLVTTTTLPHLLKYIVDQRMRYIPHQGSSMDRYLKKADFFAKCIESFCRVVASTDRNAQEAARFIWGCTEILLTANVEAKTLEKTFSAIDEQSDTLRYLSRERSPDVGTSKILEILSEALIIVLKTCLDITISLSFRVHREEITYENVEIHVQKHLATLAQCKSRFSVELWKTHMDGKSHLSGATIQTVSGWLSGQQPILHVGHFMAIGSRTARHEVTCEWLTPIVTEFFRGSQDMLLLTGPPGCGKSLAMSSVVDFARFTIQKAKLLHFSFDSSSYLRRSSLHLLKSLLLQLLEQSVGDIALFEALCNAYNAIEVRHKANEESTLWPIFSDTIRRQTEDTIIVIDGMDQIEGGHTAASGTSEQLRDIIKSRRNVRCVLLTRPFFDDAPAGWPKPYFIPAALGGDIRRFIESYTRNSTIFASFVENERQDVLHRISDQPFNSYVDAQLLLQLLETEGTYEKMQHLLDTMPRSLPGMISFICQRLDKRRADVMLIFSMLLVAERPFRMQELQQLCKSDSQLGSHFDNMKNHEQIRRSCGGLIETGGNVIRFLNDFVRDQVVQLCLTGRFPLSIKEAHGKLALKCLAFIKESISDVVLEPSFEPLPDRKEFGLVQAKLEQQNLLDYSIRCYMMHYQQSSLTDSLASPTTLTEFNSAMPHSVLLASLEGLWWESQYGTPETERLLARALVLRKSTLGASAKSTLQNLVNLAQVRRKLARHSEAMQLFFEAWTVSRKALDNHNAFCTAAARAYLDVSINVPSFETEYSQETERTYRYLWEVCQSELGEIDPRTLNYGELLVGLYLRLHELQKACVMRRDLYEVMRRHYGVLHQSTISYADGLIDLLEQLQRPDEIEGIRDLLYKSAEELDPWNPLRVDSTLRLVHLCEHQRVYNKAEGALRSLWSAILETSRESTDEIIATVFVDVSLELANFLKRHERIAESREILVILWDLLDSPDRKHNLSTGSLPIKLRMAGELMLDLDQYQVASRLFLRLRNWYLESHQETCEEAILVSIALAKCYRHTRESLGEEAVLRYLFDIFISSTKIDSTMLSICVQLVTFYETACQWSEATQICSRTLARIWNNALETEGAICDLPALHSDHAVDLALRLTHLFFRQQHLVEAERIQDFVFQACRKHYDIHDTRLLAIAEPIASLYEEMGKVDHAVTLWKELKEEAVAKLGRPSESYVKISYFLARTFKRHHRPELEDILLDLLLAFGDSADACTPESIEAVMQLIGIYEDQSKTQELQKWYHNLWLAFQDRGHDCGLDGDAFLQVYLKYITLLQKKQDLSQAIDIARKFRVLCVALYGARNLLSIKALLELAFLLEKDSSQINEAIQMYEELYSLSVPSARDRETFPVLIREARARLAVLYAEHGQASSRAEDIYLEIWRESRELHGCADSRTLTSLLQLIMFHQDNRSPERTARALSQIRDAISDVLAQEKDSSRLFSAAQHFCKMYQTLESRHEGFRLLEELRGDYNAAQIKDTSLAKSYPEQSCNFDRQSFVFILALERLLDGNTEANLYVNILQDLIKELAMYESWLRALQYGGELESRLSFGMRLLNFLRRTGRAVECERIENELWSMFHRELGSASAKSGSTWDLFVIYTAAAGGENQPSVSLLDAVVSGAVRTYEKAMFPQSYELSKRIHALVVQRGGWVAHNRSSLGLKLAICLSGKKSHSTGPSDSLAESMQQLAKEILGQVLKGGAATELDFCDMSAAQINIILVLLGKLKDYTNLERILNRLWDSRTTKTWSPSTTVNIGTRLCEARFAAGNHASALSLLQDICYNIGKSYGAQDPLAMKCQKLLVQLYGASGKDARAIEVRSNELREAAAPPTVEPSLRADIINDDVRRDEEEVISVRDRGQEWVEVPEGVLKDGTKNQPGWARHQSPTQSGKEGGGGMNADSEGLIDMPTHHRGPLSRTDAVDSWVVPAEWVTLDEISEVEVEDKEGMCSFDSDRGLDCGPDDGRLHSHVNFESKAS